MENSHAGRVSQKLEVSVILKKAVRISSSNINFIRFIFLTSLPLFGIMVFFELILGRTLVKALKITEPPYSYFYHGWPLPFFLQGRLSKDFCVDLIQVGFLYFFPLRLLELFNGILTVDSASKLYTGEKPMALGLMVQNYIEARFRSPFITLICVFYTSNCVILGSIWIATLYFFIVRNISHGYFFVSALFAAACLVLLTKYLEWSAIWTMSIAISVLEKGICGRGAFALSDRFSRDSKGDGLLLMLVFFLWELGLRSLCLYFGCYKRVGGVIVSAALICVGNVIKWVACMIYFCDRRDGFLVNVEEKVQAKAQEVDRETMLRETENLQTVIKHAKRELGDANLQLV